jgi:hypothetical protein
VIVRFPAEDESKPLLPAEATDDASLYRLANALRAALLSLGLAEEEAGDEV